MPIIHPKGAAHVMAPTGRNNWSIDFPGTGGSAGVPGPYMSNVNAIPSTNFTVLLWYYPRQVLRRTLCRWGTDPNTEGMTFRTGSNVGGATNDLQIANPSSGGDMRSTTQPVTANNWCSAAVALGATFQDANSALYHNGAALGKQGDPGAPVTTTGGLAIGYGTDIGDLPVYTHPMDGYIACFIAWSSILSAAEILELHNAGAGVDPQSDFGNYVSSANLIRSYPIEEGTDTFTDDESEAPATANRMTFAGNGTLTWYDQTHETIGGPP